MRHLKIVVRTVLSLAMSAVFVWLSLRKTDLRAVGAAMAAADPLRIALYVCVLLCVHLVRTVRWQYWFTDLDTKRRTGAWWRRTELGMFTGVVGTK